MQITVYVNTGQTACLQHQTRLSSKQLYSVHQKKHLFPVLLQVLPSTYVLFHNTLNALLKRVCICFAHNGLRKAHCQTLICLYYLHNIILHRRRLSMQLRNVVNHAKKQCNIMLNHTILGTRCLVASISLTDVFFVAYCNRR
jgi:hypothetical protein